MKLVSTFELLLFDCKFFDLIPAILVKLGLKDENLPKNERLFNENSHSIANDQKSNLA